MRAVVRCEDEDRVSQQAQVFQLVVNPSDDHVGVSNHVLEVALLVLGLAVVRVRRRHERRMHQHHRVVGKERPVAIRFDEVQQEFSEDIRTVVVGGRLEDFAVALDRRIPETLPRRVASVPETVGVEPVASRHAGRIPGALQLPFPGHGSCVTRISKQICDRVLIRKQGPEVGVIPHVAHPGHQGNPARSAKRSRVAVGEADSAVGQPVDPRGRVLTAPVRPEALVTDIVGHDQHDVGWRIGGERRQHRRQDCYQ